MKQAVSLGTRPVDRFLGTFDELVPRFHRINVLESNTFQNVDPMEAWDKLIESTQKSVDRARSQAHRLLHKATNELRRLQTERQCARELGASSEGIADWRVIARTRKQ